MSRAIDPIRLRPFVRDGQDTGRWQVDLPPHLTVTGRRERRVYASRQEAEGAVAVFKRQLRQRGLALAGRPELEGACLLDHVCKGWLAEQHLRVQAGKKKAASLVTNLHQLKPVVAELGRTAVDAITEEHLVRYQASRISRGKKPQTVNSELAVLRQVLRWGVTKGALGRVVTTDPVPVPRPIHTVFEPEDVRGLLDHLPAGVKVVVRLMMETGCRSGEALNLRWADVDLGAGVAHITRQDEWSPKTVYSERVIYLSPEVVEALSSFDRSTSYVFAGRKPNRPLTTFKKSFKTAVAKSGLTSGVGSVKVTPKSLRKLYITWQARAGTRERVLQGMVGHAPGSRITRKVYEMVTNEESRRAAGLLWEVAGPTAVFNPAP